MKSSPDVWTGWADPDSPPAPSAFGQSRPVSDAHVHHADHLDEQLAIFDAVKYTIFTEPPGYSLSELRRRARTGGTINSGIARFMKRSKWGTVNAA